MSYVSAGKKLVVKPTDPDSDDERDNRIEMLKE
jgi:hypothetical protein